MTTYEKTTEKMVLESDNQSMDIYTLLNKYGLLSMKLQNVKYADERKKVEHEITRRFKLLVRQRNHLFMLFKTLVESNTSGLTSAWCKWAEEALAELQEELENENMKY